jgi:hypothetical protein
MKPVVAAAGAGVGAGAFWLELTVPGRTTVSLAAWVVMMMVCFCWVFWLFLLFYQVF